MRLPMKTKNIVNGIIALTLLLSLISCSTNQKLFTKQRCPNNCASVDDLALKVECYTKAIEKEPTNSKLYYKRGCTYQELFLFSSAMDDFIKVVELEPGNITACYALAGVASLSLNKEYAIFWLERAFDAGFNDYQRVLKDPAFKNIRSMDKFKQLMRDRGINTISLNQ